jgi:hypothetical protein
MSVALVLVSVLLELPPARSVSATVPVRLPSETVTVSLHRSSLYRGVRDLQPQPRNVL